MMRTQFIYLNEEVKFRVVSSIFVLAILLLVFFSGLEKGTSFDIPDFERGQIIYYSKILGIDSANSPHAWYGYPAYGYKFNIAFSGSAAFAADGK